MKRPEILNQIQTPFESDYAEYLAKTDKFFEAWDKQYRTAYKLGLMNGTMGVLHAYILHLESERKVQDEYIAHLEDERKKFEFHLQSKNTVE